MATPPARDCGDYNDWIDLAVARNAAVLTDRMISLSPADAERFHQSFFYDLRLKRVPDADAIRSWLIPVVAEALPKVHRSARGAMCSVLIDLAFSDPANWRTIDGQPELRREVASNIRCWAEDDILDRGNHPSNLLPLAYLAHLERDFEHCGRMIRFALEASADTGEKLRHHELGALSYIAPTRENFRSALGHEASGEVRFKRLVMSRDFPVIVFCADPIYFLKHAKTMLDSIGRLPDVVVHFHIINPTEETDSALRFLERGSIRHGYSMEIRKSATRVYFASSRMLHAAVFLEAFGADIVIHDADIWFSQNPYELYRPFAASDLAMMRRPAALGYMPWRAVSAEAFYLRNTPIGRSAAADLSSIMAYHLSRITSEHSNWWWIDQNALHFAWEYYRSQAIQFGEISYSMIRAINHTFESRSTKGRSEIETERNYLNPRGVIDHASH